MLAAAALLVTIPAVAEVDVTELIHTHPQVVTALGRSHESSSFIVRSDAVATDGVSRSTVPPSDSLQSQLVQTWTPVPITDRWATTTADSVLRAIAEGSESAAVSEAASAHIYWSPPKRLLLDRATASIHKAQYVDLIRSVGDDTATGQGVVVGTVDSGVDFEHPDLRNADGTTRVAWFVDFFAEPHGLYPELEEEFGCTGEDFSCGILAAEEIDRLIDGAAVRDAQGRRIPLATDRLGHGTHVTSLAAGNGTAAAAYTGVAPEATLIVARVASVTAAVSDAGLLMATRFIFDRADELGMPAVVNLSLGGDFGPHDGTSAVGRALGELALQPGRAIVVAAGNSGSLYSSESLPYPAPLGIHTEIHLPQGDEARVPMLLPRGHDELAGAIYVWVETHEADRVSVGLETADGDVIIPNVPPGGAAIDEGSDVTSLIINQATADDLPGADDLSKGAAVVLEGTFAPGRVYGIILSGGGNVQLWVQSEGRLSPEVSEGVVFPGATRSGTITIPAVSPELIAVGATVNRTSWPSRQDGVVELLELGGEWLVEGAAFFSSHGPNRNGHPKPDILAPGVALAGAMAASADPLVDGTVNPLSIFGISNICDVSFECAVVSDQYAVTLGTSMAAPIVAGAAALLLERAPGLTQTELMRLIVAGARELPRAARASSQAGPGMLDLEASAQALLAASGELTLRRPSQRSWLSASDSLARPDPKWPLIVRLHLRDGDGHLADAAPGDVELQVTHGRVRSSSRVVPGLFEWVVAVDERTAGQTLRLRATHDSTLLVEKALPIAVDYNVARRGLSVRGGCGVAGSRSGAGAWGFWVGVALCLTYRRVRSRAHIAPQATRDARPTRVPRTLPPSLRPRRRIE